MTARPGPEPDPFRRYLRKQFAEWSDRTFATYWRAFQMLRELAAAGVVTDEERRDAVRLCTRANGSFNVCNFARVADGHLMRSVVADADAEQ